ncbi:hypothetical protein CAC42_858 [Sphaceloma murrayae]|uniref:Uncharacterized protein n=1 Tax=Sphaceloma murrayae TaxID=2082308 RepID=A0A2K1QL60_9PEZI|nr:hypothetical protein CAC42_858 [Sphaceloma murrayae]
MSRYQVTVRIAAEAVRALRDSGANLCCAFGFQCDESKVEYNIIAWAEDPTPVNTISWTNGYLIAACKRGHTDHSLATPNTVALPITPGDKFTLNPDWTTTVSARDDTSPSNPSNIITFENDTPSASAMVFSRIRGARASPIYLLSMGPHGMITGQYGMRPTGNMMLFFMAREEGTEFDAGKVGNGFVVRGAEDRGCSVGFVGGKWRVIKGVDGAESRQGGHEVEDWTLEV